MTAETDSVTDLPAALRALGYAKHPLTHLCTDGADLIKTTVLGCSMCRYADFDGGDDGASGAICWRGGEASIMPPSRCDHYDMDACFKDTADGR